mmetsp:Transcript_31909/g.84060  ORF Transcript_31909/g.84060 Transcript_31909/m.84060 type:complete len:498 (-) Transcript_31909:32-1525(-)
MLEADDPTASRGVPASWKEFVDAADYVDFMKDPSRIVRLEWRKVRRQQHRGFTSHSWLEAYLLDGRQMRLELFGDVGLAESIFTARRREDDSIVYEGRAAGSHEFVRPLTLERLRRIAASVASRPYSVTESNCHHFVRDVWNSAVIDILRRNHYPDRVKTGFLWGASESFGKFFLGGAIAPLAASFSSVGSTSAGNMSTAKPAADSRRRRRSRAQEARTGRTSLRPAPQAGLVDSFPSTAPSGHVTPSTAGAELPTFGVIGGQAPQHARLSAHHEDGNRISGEIFAPMRSAYDEATLDQYFAELARSGVLYVLEDGGALVDTGLPGEGPQTCRAWVDMWLPSCGDAAARLAQQIGATDVVELVQRIIPPFDDAPELARASPAFASLSSQSAATRSSSRVDQNLVSEVCYVVLAGSEVRLAIYALLQPMHHRRGPSRRLRLLSGDVRQGKENDFAYTVCCLGDSDQASSASAVDFAREELDALRVALTTGDWGFVTLL